MPNIVSISAIPADWAHSLASAEAFRQEQRCLGHAWTFLGLTVELAKDGDWVRARIGERSVFVQRFGSVLRGFENRCAHRFYPLRTADRGNGPVICGFHGWRYDQDGAAVGIPQCREMFGTIPDELGARLAGVEIATCGTLIFGRFDASKGSDTLEEFLAEGFPILEAMSSCAAGRTAGRSELVKANWKLCIHASLDDYHLVSVHPTTLGRGGPIPVQNVNYHRFGNNIAYFNTSKRTPFTDMVSDLREKAFRPTDFSIFHLCPGTFLTLFHAYGPDWYCAIVHYEASYGRKLVTE